LLVEIYLHKYIFLLFLKNCRLSFENKITNSMERLS
jgi:hypothetical protein